MVALVRRRRRDARRRPRPGDSGHAGAADRRRARGRRAPAPDGSRAWPWVAAVMHRRSASLLLGYALLHGHRPARRPALDRVRRAPRPFLGVALLSPRLVRPLAAIVGWPAPPPRRGRGPAREGNSIAEPGPDGCDRGGADDRDRARDRSSPCSRRACATSNSDAIKRQIRADFVITSQDGYTPFVAGAGDAPRRRPGAEVVHATSARTSPRSPARPLHRHRPGEASTGRYRVRVEGRRLRRRARVSSAGPARSWRRTSRSDKTLAVGDSFRCARRRGKASTSSSRASTSRRRSTRCSAASVVSTQMFDSLYERTRNQYTFATSRASDGGAAAALEDAVAAFPDARVQTRAEWIEKEDREIQQFLSLLYVLLALSVIVLDLRDREHARALDLRADARARDAAGGRDDPPPGAPDGAARERDHGADRGSRWGCRSASSSPR